MKKERNSLMWFVVVAFLFCSDKGLPNDKKETFGFEVEYTGELDATLYPFLSPEITEEESRNKEVRSLVFDSEVEMLAGLKYVVANLGTRQRSIHIHRRIPKGTNPAQGAQAAAIASRLSDIVLLWRLERAPKIATTSWSQERRSPQGVTTTKGSVFLQDFGKEWDFETRGIYNDPELATWVSNAFSHYLKKGEKFKNLLDVQTALSLRTEGLAEMVERAGADAGAPLTEQQRSMITLFEKAARYSALFPLYHYEKLPGLEASDKEKIEKANQLFAERVLSLTRERGGSDSAVIQFRGLLSRWAVESDLRKTLEKDLEIQSKRPLSKKVTEAFTKERILETSQSKQSRIRSEGEAVAKNTGISDWLEERLSEELVKPLPDRTVLFRLLALEGPRWDFFLRKILSHPSKDTRILGTELFYSRAPAKVPVELLEEAMTRENHPEVKNKLFETLGYLMKKGIRLSGMRGQYEVPMSSVRPASHIAVLQSGCAALMRMIRNSVR